jgi:putative transposase
MDIDTRKKIAETRKATHARRENQVMFARDLKIVTNKLNKAQKEALRKVFLEAKWLRNDCLANGIDNYKSSNTVNVKTPDGMETRELKYLGASMKQSVIQQLKTDRSNLAKKKRKGHAVGALKFKSYVNTIPLKAHGTDYRQYKKNHNRFKIQGIPGRVWVRGLRQIPKTAELANAKLTRRADGYHLIVTICIDKNQVKRKHRIKNTAVGIDFGLRDEMTFSDGETLNVRFDETKRVKGLQRRLARKINRSRNYNKVCDEIRREHLKSSNKRDNAANQLCSALAVCEYVVTQDDNLNSWKKRRKYKKRNGRKTKRGMPFGGRKIQTGILGRVKKRLNHMDNACLLPRDVRTTQYCHCCGDYTPHSVDKSVFTCGCCGYTGSRDVHAAQNMLLLGKDFMPAGRGLALVELVGSGYGTDFSALIPNQLAVKRETLKSLV